jgi:hypothetical protein
MCKRDKIGMKHRIMTKRSAKIALIFSALLVVGIVVVRDRKSSSVSDGSLGTVNTARWWEAVKNKPASSFIAELEAQLNAQLAADSARLIRELLESGVDAVTHQPFKIGPGGNLSTAPTFRVWLLDQFGRRSALEAAAYSSRIYETSTSADEWALALRNDWRVAVQAGRISEVRMRVLELLGNQSWAENPSVGFLEAFDVAVVSMAWEAIPRFEGWISEGKSKALLNGSWLALDRLAQEAPTDFSAQLIRNPNWLGSQPKLRAGLMARANLAVEPERLSVEAYLSRSDLSEPEVRRFFELFPNVNGTFSHNLVSEPRLVSLVEAAHRDRAALQGVRSWLGTPNFSKWRLYLTAAESRLVEACASAERGGVLTP